MPPARAWSRSTTAAASSTPPACRVPSRAVRPPSPRLAAPRVPARRRDHVRRRPDAGRRAAGVAAAAPRPRPRVPPAAARRARRPRPLRRAAGAREGRLPSCSRPRRSAPEPWPLRFLGSGPAEDALASRADRLGIGLRVSFRPFLADRERLARAYAGARCVVMPGAARDVRPRRARGGRLRRARRVLRDGAVGPRGAATSPTRSCLATRRGLERAIAAARAAEPDRMAAMAIASRFAWPSLFEQETARARGARPVRREPKRHAIAVSIHDVEPATFERCALIRDWLDDHGVDRVTLLVIPAPDLHPFSNRRPELADWLAERVHVGRRRCTARLPAPPAAPRGAAAPGARAPAGRRRGRVRRARPAGDAPRARLRAPPAEARGHRAARLRGAGVRLHARAAAGPGADVRVVGGHGAHAPRRRPRAAGARAVPRHLEHR